MFFYSVDVKIFQFAMQIVFAILSLILLRVFLILERRGGLYRKWVSKGLQYRIVKKSTIFFNFYMLNNESVKINIYVLVVMYKYYNRKYIVIHYKKCCCHTKGCFVVYLFLFFIYLFIESVWAVSGNIQYFVNFGVFKIQKLLYNMQK
eukprot:TRINITY_DN25619_c0_g2_i1.p2 TRINITY_DN25619_c0_g2~~TRINITY_DN25619_c0_g2_i1.p2  ORF type:complete len:148 (-),score=1.17 TRINITY_DN25619_c0_g2_i1:106-549(-)